MHFSDKVANHYDSKTEKKLKRNESAIYPLCLLHNWVKASAIDYGTKLLDEYNGLIVLDLACGKGGDIMKWERWPIKKYIGIDISEKSIKQAKKRRLRMTADFHVLDCWTYPIKSVLKNPNIRFDIVSCQFALHYAFESEETLTVALANIAGNLKKGGIFMCTLPNADEIITRAEKSNCFGNEFYSIKLNDEKDPSVPRFGASYIFDLKDAIDNLVEFLPYKSLLIEYGTRAGLELIASWTFPQFIEKCLKDPKLQKLSVAMKVMDMDPCFLEISKLYQLIFFIKK